MITRPIEFKVWHKPTQRMYEVSDIDFESQEIFQQLPEDALVSEWDEVYENPFKFEDSILLQFTGLFDERGQKIFEGDVLRNDSMWTGEVPEGESEYSEYSFVGFHNGGFANYPLYSEHSEEEINSLVRFGIFYLSQLYRDGHVPMQRVASMHERPDLLELKAEYPLHPNAIRYNGKLNISPEAD